MPPLNGRRRWRQQPPAHSPISAPALGHALVSGLGGQDPRLTLAERLAHKFEADHVVLTDSGTDALQLTLGAAFHAIPGPRIVALPAYSCFDVATAAIGSGALVVCYDLDPGTLGPDLASVRWCLQQGARVIVLAPLYGVPIDTTAIDREAAEWNAVVIEDAAQGFGASWQERPLGTLASLSVLSFGRGKGWTGGSGGAVLCRDPAPWSDLLTLLGGRSRGTELLAFGAAAAQWVFGRPEVYALPFALPALHLGETRYHPPRVARPMHRFAAALLEQTAAAAEAEAAYRREVGGWYDEAVPWSSTLLRIRGVPRGRSGCLRYPVLCLDGWGGLRDPAAARALGLAPGYPRALTRLPQIAALLPLGCKQRTTPGADELVHRLITLPTHSLLTMAERASVVRMLENYGTVERESSLP